MLTGEARTTNDIELNWRIADGYYLYKQRIKLEPADADAARWRARAAQGRSRTATNISASRKSIAQSLDATFSVPPSDAKSVDVNVTYQGCADAGLCYPPHHQDAFDLARGRAGGRLERAPPAAGGYVSEQDSFAAKIAARQLFAGHRDRLSRRIADGVHALRAADGADPLRHHRGRRLEHVAAPRGSCCR